MGSKQEYDAAKKIRETRDEAELASLNFALVIKDLFERLVVATEKIANKP